MKLNILLFCDKPKKSKNANTILDHISAFEQYSEHNILIYSMLRDIPPKLDLNKFDVIIVHYTLSLLYEYYISSLSKNKLREFNGLKVLFVQDEYRQINKMITEINFINFDILFTCFPSSEIERIYPTSKLPNLVKYNNLTGYVPENLVGISSYERSSERKIDVGYRGRKIPFWLGELAYEKCSIVDQWKKYTANANLIMDISYHEDDRIYGEKWIQFLTSCKTTLGVESGASVMDFTGRLEKIIDFHQKTFPEDSFYDVQKYYLTEHEGKYKLNQISPRCFEAIALKTVLILYEGEYSGVLIPGRHYISLKKDFSNINKVLDAIKDNDFLQQMGERAYNEIVLSSQYSYQSFIKRVDQIVASEFIARDKNKVNSYNYEELLQEVLFSQSKESYVCSNHDPGKINKTVSHSILSLLKRLIIKIKILNSFVQIIQKLLIKSRHL
ncbi:hypothetical protein [Legionella impletisoli]|uniref:Glycosyl transferases group 1 n=1 Tax=Legionella impletisoli TaxID=343510 RepID=A0A917N9L3_9GAMM|nr:hypothetical protein [Legionella impletisoli]GGI80093.1 hypothetical protein GCM10007966_05760 [Legionella impletisoli]